MEYTQNYQLPLWDKEDAVLRTDFNENNQKIDAAIAAGVKIEHGSYVGTGTFGPGTQNTLTFSFSPKVVIIVADTLEETHPGVLFFAGQQCSGGFGGTNSATQYRLNLTWGENTLSWATEYGAINGAKANWQLNTSGVTYRYTAIG